ncbi:immunity protein YezG family protein [Kribbella sp. NPDC059898]|uniref:immunity protein YezG family protein n=1 Tax=Kribbella sp. NPDC059898 TaxID=3346995 RepID=UPI00365C9732
MTEKSQELLSRIGRSMARSAPSGWEQTELRITGAGPMSGTTLRATAGDNSTAHKIALDHDGQDAADDLRKEMYQPGKGAWYNATITLTHTGKLAANFDYDTPPFEGDADSDLLIEDDRLFPRDPEHLPPWHPAKTG